MSKLTVNQLKALVRQGLPVSKSDGRGLYFVVPKRGEAYFSFRFTNHLGKRRIATLGHFGKMPFYGIALKQTEADQHSCCLLAPCITMQLISCSKPLANK